MVIFFKIINLKLFGVEYFLSREEFGGSESMN